MDDEILIFDKRVILCADMQCHPINLTMPVLNAGSRLKEGYPLILTGIIRTRKSLQNARIAAA